MSEIAQNEFNDKTNIKVVASAVPAVMPSIA